MIKARRWLVAAALAGFIGASAPAMALDRPDALEPFNRTMFGFNGWLVLNVIDPLGNVLRAAMPGPIQAAAGNFYENLTEPEFAVGNWLAGEKRAASQSLRRFIINSTLGLGGIFDVATALGISRTHVEWGAALCQTGLPTGPYLVLPLIGPTNIGVASSTSIFFVGGFYLLNLISPWLATADLVLDLSGSAASLRYADEAPDHAAEDPYVQQRIAYWRYLTHECATLTAPADVTTAAGVGPAVQQ